MLQDVYISLLYIMAARTAGIDRNVRYFTVILSTSDNPSVG